MPKATSDHVHSDVVATLIPPSSPRRCTREKEARCLSENSFKKRSTSLLFTGRPWRLNDGKCTWNRHVIVSCLVQLANWFLTHETQTLIQHKVVPFGLVIFHR